MTPATRHSFDRTIDSDPARIAEVRRAVERLMRDAGFDAVAADDVGLAINEALANVIRHAYHGAKGRPIAIRATVDENAIELTIRDWGSGIVPDLSRTKCERDLLTPGGLGLDCMRKLTDDLRFDPQPDGMLLTMRRNRKRKPS